MKFGNFDFRKIASYPSHAKTLRGVGGDVLYLEEAAFLDTEVFNQIIVPLLEMDTTALIGISTPQDSQNFYSEMFELKDATGQNFFRTIRVSLVCQACKDAGKGSECTHNQDLIPPWKSAAKLDLVRALYGDNKDLMERESMGAITADADSVFAEKMIDTWMQMKPLQSDPNFFFTAVDPTGGGQSYMAVVSLVLVGTECYIVGLDAAPANGPEEIRALLIQHLRGVRAHPRLRSAWNICIFESNLGQEAAHMRHMVKDERLTYVIHEKKRPGVMTTNSRKELYVQALLEHQHGMHLIPDLVCVNPKADANVRTVMTKKEFRKQLLMFKKLVIPGANAFNLPKIVYTGKCKTGQNDDLVLCLMIGVFWAREFYNKKIPNIDYTQFREIK